MSGTQTAVALTERSRNNKAELSGVPEIKMKACNAKMSRPLSESMTVWLLSLLRVGINHGFDVNYFFWMSEEELWRCWKSLQKHF